MKPRIFILVLLVILCSTCLNAQTTKGKDFWFGYMYNLVSDAPLEVYISSERVATATVTIPGTGFSQIVNVPANTTAFVSIPNSIMAAEVSDVIEAKAVHVETCDTVSVYAINKGAFSDDATVVYPTSALGGEYMVLTKQGAPSDWGKEFLIVPTTNNSVIQITPSVATDGGHAAGVPYNITLNKGDMYQVTSADDLTGTLVKSVATGTTSCSNFAVFSGSKCLNIGGCTACDHLYEQLMPTKSWGKNFVIGKFAQKAALIFRVLSKTNGTSFTIDGGAPINLNYGQFFEYSNSGGVGPSYITSNNPIMIMQYMSGAGCDGSGMGDPDQVLISPIEQTMNVATFFTIPSAAVTSFYANVAAKTSAVAGMSLNGASISSFFIPIPSNPLYSYAQGIPLTQNTNYQMKSDTGFCTFVYGLGSYESYSYPVGSSVKDLTSDFTIVAPPSICPGGVWGFNAVNDPNATAYLWNYGDGATGSGINSTHAYTAEGTFSVTLTKVLSGSCNVDVVKFLTVKRPSIKINGVDSICSGQAVNLWTHIRNDSVLVKIPTACGDTLRYKSVTHLDSVLWSTGSRDSLITVSPLTTTKYYLNGYATGTNCFAIDSFVVHIVKPTASFITDDVCQGIATTFTNSSTPTTPSQNYIVNYQWDFTNNGIVDSGGLSPSTSTVYPSSGSFTAALIVTDLKGCKDTVLLPVNVWGHSIPDFSPTNVCFGTASTFSNMTNTTTNANVGGTPTWSWDFGDGSASSSIQDPTHTYTTTGVSVYNVTLTATTLNGCVDNIVKTVTINPLPTATFTPVNACLNTNVVLNNTSSIVAPDNITTYAWNFGAGAMPTTTSSVQNPLGLTYTSSGIKNIILTLTSNNTCTATITQTVNVYPQPVANFSTTSVCQGTATAYTDMSTPTGSMTAWAWDFTNNGSVDNVTNAPSNTFPSSGTFTTNLIVTDNNSCKDTVALPLNVWGHAIPNFTATTVCLGSSSTFSNMTNTTTNANVGGTPTWSWDFGDGSATNSLQDPIYTYSSTTIYSYSVVLTATTTNGCVDNIMKVVTVHVLPTATFTPVNACMNTNVLLNNSSSIPAPDNISAYAWDFGTGSAPTTTSAVQNPPLLTYNSSGVKTVTLTITANTSCTATITNTVTIYPQPVANFSTTSVCQGIATAYTDLSTPTGSITAWAWDFTNNGSPDNATNAPTNIFSTSGTFTSGLIVTDNNTCKDTIALPLNVWGHTIPNFTPDKVCYGTASVFTNLTDETTNPNVGLGTTYVWDFADTSPTTTIVNPNHTYNIGANANATYSVLLTATSLHNCVDSIRKPVSVYAVPTASFTSDSVCLGSTSHLTDVSNGNGNAINAYEWDYLSDGTVDVTGVANPNFVFPAFGNNNVTYTVSTTPVIGLVCSNTTNTIQVWVNPLPVPDFTFVNNCINAQPNTFNGSTSMIAIGTNTAYVWAYGDGAVSTATPASTSTHTYALAGIYNVTLTLTSNKGCQNTISKAVEVYEKPKVIPTASVVCDQAATTFTAVTQPNSGTIVDWSWDLNNVIAGPEGNGQTVSYTYPAPGAGSHTISVLATTDHLCVDTFTGTVYVNYVPTPFFTVDDSAGCPRHCVTFTDLTPVIPGPASLATWTWDLGDGSNPTVNNSNLPVNNCYINNSSNQLAQYTVKLTVTTDAGCTNSLTKSNYITVFPKPIANYTVNPNPSNVLEPLVYFTNQSQDYTKWWWTFVGTGPFKIDSVNINPEHFYDNLSPQTYYSNLIVANQYGCMDTAYVPVEIGPEFTFYIPNAFTPTKDDGINDYFNGMGIGIAQYEMWVFDRWGANIFYTDDIEKGWDGKVQGKSDEKKHDVYAWKVKITDILGKKHNYVGHVTLIK